MSAASRTKDALEGTLPAERPNTRSAAYGKRALVSQVWEMGTRRSETVLGVSG